MPWLTNDLDDNIAVHTTEYLYNGSKYFEKYLAKKQKGKWRLFLMDGQKSPHTYEFLKFCEYLEITTVRMPSYTTHLFQPLDVCIFQPLQHWHSEAVNEAL